MNDFLKQLYDMGIVPVIKINHDKNAVLLAKALLTGGLSTAEITFRSASTENPHKF